MKQKSMKPVLWPCIPLLAGVLLFSCTSAQPRATVEYFRLKAAKIDSELITEDGSTVTIEYEEIIPFEGNELKLAVQTRESISEEDRREYRTPQYALIGITRTTYYVGENVVIPAGYLWKKYKMSNGEIEFRITDDEKLSGVQTITVYLSQHDTMVSNSVTVRGVFQE